MALSANTVFEVRNGGSDTNGGGWVTGSSASGGTDWSQQTAAQYSVTDGVTAGSTIITSATAAFGADVVGNIMYVQGGTGAVSSGWYQIITRTSSTTITVDRLTGLTSGTGATLKIGGAFASPGTAAGVATVAGMTTFIKYSSTPFTISSTTNNVSGGCISGTNATAYAGYDTTRSLYNTDANRATVRLSSGTGSATAIFTAVNNVYLVQSLIVDANSVTTSQCLNTSGEFFNVKAMNATTAGIQQNGATGRAILCEVTGCTATPILISIASFCVSHDNILTSPTNAASILVAAGGVATNCISYNNNGDGYLGSPSATPTTFLNCVAYANGGAGFNVQNNNTATFVNCISESNTGSGFRTNTGSLSMINCATFGNSSARFFNAGGGRQWTDLNPITGSGSFFTNAAGGVFTLNNTAGAGALCRAAGFPASVPTSTSNADYADVGTLQSSAGGGGTTTTIYGVMGS